MAMIRGVGSEVLQQAYRQANTTDKVPDNGGFASRLEQLVGEVDRMQDQAGDLQTRAVRGEPVEIHEVMIASQEASLAMSMMIEIRNKLVEGYQELMRMQA